MRDAKSSIEAGAATHVGRVRRQNEDNYLVATRCGLWAVADGMGGHEAGDIASRLVVEELAAIGIPASASELLASCEQHIVSANSQLKKLGDERGALIGTTVAVLLIFGGHFAAVWSGDSRIYRIRRHRIEQISVDHTEVQELISQGKLTAEEARAWPGRNVITRAIGVSDNPELEIKGGALESGDIFVICSDGLTAHVEDKEILTLASAHRPQQACDLLVTLTLERGAVDNVTVVAVRFDPAAVAAKPPPYTPSSPSLPSPAPGGGLGRGAGEGSEGGSRDIWE
jgi:serine/threonine protein phosphatase PrpC